MNNMVPFYILYVIVPLLYYLFGNKLGISMPVKLYNIKSSRPVILALLSGVKNLPYKPIVNIEAGHIVSEILASFGFMDNTEIDKESDT